MKDGSGRRTGAKGSREVKEDPTVDKAELEKKVVKGSAWVLTLSGVNQVFNIVRLIVLARLLTVDDFGLLGIALLVMLALETFSQTGFMDALIQKKKNIRSFLNAAWTVQVIRGFVLFAVIFAIAPLAARFFDVGEATLVVRVLGVNFLLQAFINIGVVQFQKELQFNKYFAYMFSGTLADFTVAIVAAVILQNIWALVLGLLAGNAVRLIVSYAIHDFRPRFTKDLSRAKELWGFGKWVLGATVLTFLLTQGDILIVGKVLGVTALGFYTMAYRFSNAPTTEITHVISKVMFPAYSMLQDDEKGLKNGYLKVLLITSTLSFLMGAMLFALGHEFTVLLLGDHWEPMVLTLQILAIWGITRSVGACTGPLFKAVGRPDIPTKLMMVRLVIFLVMIIPMTIWWGIVGTALAVAASGLIMRPVTDYIVIRTIKCTYGEFLRVMAIPVAGFLAAWLAVWASRAFIFADVGIIQFVIMGLLGAGAYMGMALGMDRILGTKLWETTTEKLRQLTPGSK